MFGHSPTTMRCSDSYGCGTLLLRFIESGEYGGMTIRDICASIGVTTGLFYRHFNSKNEALAAWLVQEMREYIDHYTEKK